MSQNHYRHPTPGRAGRLLARLANSRRLPAWRRAVLSRLPFLKLRSDVEHVVYLNWVVPSQQVAALVPPGMTVWQREGTTILTALTYRHGHFGPLLAGPGRRACPSPLQSNWRLYIDALPTAGEAPRTVLFIKNLFSTALHAVGTRLFSDLLPSHLPDSFIHQPEAEGYRTRITAGEGSAPELACITRFDQATPTLPAEFRAWFTSWPEAVRQLALQDHAVTQVEGLNRLAHGSIDLPIDLATVRPLTIVQCQVGAFLQSLGATNQPFCFAVPAVPFTVLSERLL